MMHETENGMINLIKNPNLMKSTKQKKENEKPSKEHD